MANGFYYQVNNNDMPTVIFLVIFWVIFLLYLILIGVIQGKNTKSEEHSLAIIIFFAILFRFVLLPGEMIHENDIYRYLWDGKVFSKQINPYKYAPADLYMFEEGIKQDHYDRFNDVTIKAKNFKEVDKWRMKVLLNLRDENSTNFDRIGHWQVPTIYPPLTQVVFLSSRRDSILAMKTLFVVFDLFVICLIISLLNHLNLNPLLCIIYAWSPLVLKEIPNSGHYESIPIFFTLLAVYLFFRRNNISGFLALAFGTLTKFFSGILVPIFLRQTKFWYIFVFSFICILVYVPFILWNQVGLHGVFEGLITYQEEWSYNSSLFSLIYMMLDKYWPQMTVSLIPSKIVAGVLYLLFLMLLIIKKGKDDREVVQKCFMAIAMLFLISPVGDPWYFCWVLPFLCIFPLRSWIVLSGLLTLSYLNFHSDIHFFDQRFFNIPILSLIIYVPFFILMLLEILFRPKYLQGSILMKKDDDS